METIVKLFGEFGVLAALLAFFCVGSAMAVKWVADHAVVPLVTAGVDYLNKQTEITIKNVECLENLALLESDIKTALLDMNKSHDDPDSVFATVHTNESINTLAKAVQRIAKALDCNVDDLVVEIERVLKRQHA